MIGLTNLIFCLGVVHMSVGTSRADDSVSTDRLAIQSVKLTPSIELLSGLLERIETVERTVAKQEATEQQHQRELSDLREELSLQKEMVKKLEVENDRQRNEINAIKATTNKEPVQDSPRHASAKLEQNTFSDNGVSLGRSQRTVVTHVAFFAKLETTPAHLAPNHTVIFEKVETNVGGGYNANTGFFTTPVPGTYVFTVTLTTFSVFVTDCGFALNGRRLTEVYINGAGNAFDSAGQTILLKLRAGDVITMQQAASEGYLEGSGHSLFTGFLLYEDPRGVTLL